MDVDAAGHRDEPARVDCLVRLRAGRRRDDFLVADPQIADFVTAVGGIDDMRVSDVGQHDQALASSRRAPMRSSAWAALGAALRAEAVMATSVPASDECRTAS